MSSRRIGCVPETKYAPWSGTFYLDDYYEFNSGAMVVLDDKQTYQYDALDLLTQAVSGTLTAQFGYDADGKRVITKTYYAASGTTRTLFDVCI